MVVSFRAVTAHDRAHDNHCAADFKQSHTYQKIHGKSSNCEEDYQMRLPPKAAVTMNQKQDKASTYLEGEKVPHFKSLSGIEYKEVYDQSDWPGELQDPGEYPFTRGIHKDMYRGRLWTRRQQI